MLSGATSTRIVANLFAIANRQLNITLFANGNRCSLQQNAMQWTDNQWRIQRGGGGGAAAPYWLIFFSKKPLFSVQKAYILLCAFAINEDAADKLSSPPFQNFWIRHCRQLYVTYINNITLQRMLSAHLTTYIIIVLIILHIHVGHVTYRWIQERGYCIEVWILNTNKQRTENE